MNIFDKIIINNKYFLKKSICLGVLLKTSLKTTTKNKLIETEGEVFELNNITAAKLSILIINSKV